MSKIEIIRTVLEPGFLAHPANKLEEENTAHRGRTIRMDRDIVTNKDIQYLLYRFDPDKGDIFPFFSAISGLKKICDYILFAEEGKSCWCLLIEMKMGRDSPHAQLAASECFVRYVIEAAARVGKSIACDDINFRRIGIPEFKKQREGEREEEVSYVNGYLQLTSRALRLPSLLQ